MDNERITSTILSKKVDNYKSNENDFVLPTEITVTITLAEYRSLVSQAATRKTAIDSAEKDKYSRELEIKTVKEENARLKGENYDLKTQVDVLRTKIIELSGKDDA